MRAEKRPQLGWQLRPLASGAKGDQVSTGAESQFAGLQFVPDW